jgi:tetratricopeptide (TPR) repeat protein
MEEHYQAYFAWKAQGLEKAWCWHVDAHLDIGEIGLSPERLATLKNCRSRPEASDSGCLGSSYLPWGGLHCGNYLHPAIKEGIVGRLTWVIPPDLPEMGLLTWAKHHLNNWFEMSPQEMRSLELDGGRLTGTLMGIPFELGTLEHLELPTEPVLLDIDIDYFLKESGEVWQESQEFVRLIESIPSRLTTVAYSVKGGFTPEVERRLADPFLQGESIEQMDHEPYRERPIDQLATLVRRHQHQEAISVLDSWDELDVESSYLKGTSLHALKRYEETLAIWEHLLRSADLPPDGQHYFHNLCSELLLSLDRPQECLEHCRRAQKLDRSAYAPYWTEAQVHDRLGEHSKQIKALRRAAKLSENKIFGLKVRTALIRAYRRQGKEGLALVETQKLNQIDPDQKVRGFALLGGC